MDEPRYVAKKRCRSEWPSTKCLSNKRRIDDDVAELQPAKRTKLREGTTICPHGDTCDNAESQLAADGDRSGQYS